MMKTNNGDLYDLIYHLQQSKGCDVEDFDEYELENWLFNEYEIDFESFEKLINVLVPLIEVGKSPLTEKIYQGFAVDGHWLIKKEYNCLKLKSN